MMDNINDPLDALIDAHLHHLEGEAAAPDLADLPADLQAKATARIALLEACWGVSLEPPEEDPVARRFGFDRAGKAITIDGSRVASYRKATGIDLKELLARVETAGGRIAPGALYRLEQSRSTSLDQPTASALVAALKVALADIEAAGQSGPARIRAFLDGPPFHQLIDDWAGTYGRDRTEVRREVARQVVAAQYRAEDVTDDQLIEMVQAILETLEL